MDYCWYCQGFTPRSIEVDYIGSESFHLHVVSNGPIRLGEQRRDGALVKPHPANLLIVISMGPAPDTVWCTGEYRVVLPTTDEDNTITTTEHADGWSASTTTAPGASCVECA